MAKFPDLISHCVRLSPALWVEYIWSCLPLFVVISWTRAIHLELEGMDGWERKGGMLETDGYKHALVMPQLSSMFFYSSHFWLGTGQTITLVIFSFLWIQNINHFCSLWTWSHSGLCRLMLKKKKKWWKSSLASDGGLEFSWFDFFCFIWAWILTKWHSLCFSRPSPAHLF